MTNPDLTGLKEAAEKAKAAREAYHAAPGNDAGLAYLKTAGALDRIAQPYDATILSLIEQLAETREALELAESENARWLARIADIREAAGVGSKPMLSELPDAIRAALSMPAPDDRCAACYQRHMEHDFRDGVFWCAGRAGSFSPETIAAPRPPVGEAHMRVHLVRGKVYGDLAIRHWTHEGLTEGEHVLYASPITGGGEGLGSSADADTHRATEGAVVGDREPSAFEEQVRDLIRPHFEDVAAGTFNVENSACRAARMIAGSLRPGHHLNVALAALQPQEAASVPGGDGGDDLGQTIDERDRAEAAADRMAALIGRLTGSEPGEHSSANDPWRNAIDEAEALLAQPGAGECAPSSSDVFDFLEMLADRIEANGEPERAQSLRAGFARGTGGVGPADYLVDILAPTRSAQ